MHPRFRDVPRDPRLPARARRGRRRAAARARRDRGRVSANERRRPAPRHSPGVPSRPASRTRCSPCRSPRSARPCTSTRCARWSTSTRCVMYPNIADTLEAYAVTSANGATDPTAVELAVAPRPSRSWSAAAKAMGIDTLRQIDTGLDPVTAEREQWDDGNNTLALGATRRGGLRAQRGDERAARGRRHRRHRHLGVRAGLGPRRAAVHVLPDLPRTLPPRTSDRDLDGVEDPAVTDGGYSNDRGAETLAGAARRRNPVKSESDFARLAVVTRTVAQSICAAAPLGNGEHLSGWSAAGSPAVACADPPPTRRESAEPLQHEKSPSAPPRRRRRCRTAGPTPGRAARVHGTSRPAEILHQPVRTRRVQRGQARRAPAPRRTAAPSGGAPWLFVLTQ